MSAITGIFYRDGQKVDSELIKKMNKRLSHRGPDGSKVWCEGSVAFGHQMLFTTPESLHEKLPFYDEKAGLIITADARIDNRNELSKELNITDHVDVSDSYFILRSYQMWGEKCPEHLLGDFAFAIWDKNEEKLFCARDHMGVKPFYYYLSPGMFIFSTEIKALFSVPGVPKEINEQKLAYFLEMIDEDDRETTFYDEIHRLPAANSIKVNNENFYLHEYWKLDLDYHLHLGSHEEYEKMFRDIFTEAVQCRLRSAYPVGSMLSGGLDSSSVSCVAQKILQENGKNKLKTFSAIFNSVPESNELYFIEKVLSNHDFDYFMINADEISPLDEINDYLWYADSPLIVPNTFMNYNIYCEANENGVRVLLDGYEGDDVVFHGDKYLTELFSTLRWKKLIAEIKGLKEPVSYRKIFSEICFNSLPFFLKRNLLSLFKKKKMNIIKKDLALKVNLIKIIQGMDEESIRIKNAHEQHHANLSSSIIQEILELDWMSVPFNIEARHPFFDKRLVEFCLAIPTEQKISSGWDRYIMRHAMSKILPKDVAWRKNKSDLSFNFNRGLMGEREQLDELISENDDLKKYIDTEKLEEIYNECKSGDISNSGYIWNALLLNLWLQKI